MDLITLKNAYRYQNLLKSLIDEVRSHLSYSGNYTTTIYDHKISEAVEGGIDKTLTSADERAEDFLDINTALKILMSLTEDYDTLSKEITKGKIVLMDSKGYDVDGMVASNKIRQNTLSYLRRINTFKTGKRKSTSQIVVPNINKDPVVYSYVVEKVTKADFDRAELLRLISSQSKLINSVSDDIELAQNLPCVMFDTKYNFGDTLDDVVRRFRD